MNRESTFAKESLSFLKDIKIVSRKTAALSYSVSSRTLSLSLIMMMFSLIVLTGPDALSQSYNISDYNGQTVTTCNGFFYDSGGLLDPYNNDENYTVTFCSGNGNAVKFDFTSFIVRTGDTLYVYDGPDATFPSLGKYSGTNVPVSLISSGTCMTFTFVSNFLFTRPGWSATITCCPPPVISAILPNDVYQCAGSAIYYYVDDHAGSTYNWTITNGTPLSVIGGPNHLDITWDVDGDITGYAKVVEVNSCGSKDSTTLIVDIYSLPVVDFSGLDPYYCIYSPPVTLIGSPAGGVFSGPGISGDTFTPSDAGEGTHNIVYDYTNPVTGCRNQKIIQTAIIIPDIFNVGASANSYCAGFSVDITLSGSETGMSYQLLVNGVNDGPALAGTGSPLTWSNKKNGIYTVVAINNASLCTSNMAGSQTITELILPVPTFTTQAGATTCSTSTATYTTQAGQTNYIWGFTGISGTDYLITSGGSTSDNNVSLRWLTSGSKTVTVNYTNSNGCTAVSPTSSSPTIVTVTPLAPTGTPIQNFCSETSPTVASLSATGAGIKWYAASSGGTALPAATPLIHNTHYYASQSINGCESLTRLDVTAMIYSIPLPPVAGAGTGATCTQITAHWSASAGAASYRLDVSLVNTFATFVAGFQDRNVGNVTAFNVPGLTAGTTYYYRVRAVDFCGTSGNSATITYATLPATPAVPGAITGTATQCFLVPGQIYSIAAVPNATVYTWTVPAGWAINSGQGTVSISVTTGAVGQNGNITVTAGNACGTSGARSLAVTVIPNASITSVTGISPLCIGGTATYTATGVVLSGGTGGWSSSNPAVASVTAGGLVTGMSAGTCNIIYTITGGCGGTVSAQQAVTIRPNASITSVTGATPVCITGTTVYTANGVVLSGGVGAWSSTNPAVATVNGAGLVTGITAGTTNIRYTITGGCGGIVFAQQSITVQPNASITSVTGTTPVCITETAVYSANGVVLSGGTGAWSSSNPAVATVSAAGLVTGVTAGNCNIIYTITGGCGSTVSAQQSVTVRPNASITSVTGTTPLCIGGTNTYTANGVVPGGGTGAWSSSNPAVATVNAAGLVTGITAGTSNIIYTITGGCGGTVSAQQTVTIQPNASIISVTGTSPLCISGTATYAANGVVLSGGTGAWSSSNPGVATVNAAGLVTGVSAGTANIRYTITGGCGTTVFAQQSVTISPNASITSVTGTSPLCIAGTATYNANGVVLSGGTGAWSSSNTAVATVSAAGLVTGVAAGTANIRYTITGGCGATVFAQRTVTIRPNARVTSVTGTTPLCINANANFTANGVVLGGGTGAWSSSNTAIATVNPGGMVRGVSAGTCNIIYTVTGGCGGTASALLAVTILPDAAIASVTGASPICIGGTATYTANGAVLSGGTGAWSSDNTSIATVSPAGLVTGIASGTCNIIYTITGGCGGTVSAQQPVTVQPDANITSVTGTSPLCIGGTATFAANGVVLSGGTGAWSSSNVAVATVDAAGLVTGVSAGSCNIIYTITGGCGGTVSAQQGLTILPNAGITSVTGNTPICIAGTATYTANGVVLSGGTGAWSSSDPAIATVSAAGLVTGVSAGTCNIIYAITGGCGGTVSAQQAVTILPNASITSVTGATPICIGGTANYTANGVVLSGGTGAWSSSNPAVATVSAAGLVTGVSAGTSNIIYTITGGCGITVSALQSVTVRPNASITSVTGTTPLCISGTATYTANGVVLSGGSGVWSSSNAAVASVNAAGVVTGVSAGTCNIIYTITGGCGATVSAQQSVTIRPNASITSVTGTTPLCIGGTATYTANGVVLSGGAGAWSSSNIAVATVNAAGLVTGISAGTCNIIYTITGGCGGTVSAQQAVTIQPNASIISVTGTTPMCIGGTANYTANGVVLSGGTGAWSSSNVAIATVSATGLVTGISAGSCNIIYTITGGCGSTVSAQQAVTIQPNAGITSVTGTTPLCIAGTATYTANGVVLSGGAGTWSSSNTAVATVSAAGLVSGVSAGTCNIIYTITGGCGGTVSAQQSVIVQPNASITSVTGTTPLCISGTATYSANGVVLSGGTGAWSSSNPAVATVSAAGLVSGIAAGTCNIIYTVTGGCGGSVSAQQSVTIRPNAAITSVTGVSPLCIGGNATYVANGVILGGGTGAWSSSNPAVATVSAAGLVTGISAGSCNIIYTITGGCGGTVSALRALTIRPNASITSVTGTTPLCIGGTATYTANGVVLGGGTGAWSSSNAAVASVNAAGLVTGISAGTCNIVYTITGGCGSTVSRQQTVVIQPNASITSVTGVSPLCIGGTSTYNANGVVLSGGTGAWSSSNSAVATVNAAGLVTGVSAGTCNIIYTITGGCGGNVSAQQSLTIQPNAGIASVTGTSPLCIGGTATYIANGVVLSGGTGAWSSSNPAVATVNAAGLVTGITAGTCNIIYTITGGCGTTVSAQQSVTVQTDASVASVTGTTPLCIAGTATYTANGAVMSGGTGLWSSSNPAVATVNPAGLVTGVTAGTCNIIYTISGGCGGIATASASVVISAPPAATISYNITPVCSNSGIQNVTITGTPGGTFTSSPAGLTIDAVTGAITTGSSVPGTYTVDYTMISAECGNGLASTSVTINQAPSVIITDPSSVCFPLTVDLMAGGITAGSSAGLIFTYWTDPAGTIAYPTPGTAGSGVYYIKGTDIIGCYDIKPVTVTVNPIPVISGIQTNVLCAGESNGTIDISVTAGTGPFGYSWTGAGVIPTDEDQTGLAAGLYSVVVTDALGCTSVSTPFTITTPVVLTGSVTSQTDVSVYGGSDGSVNVVGSGGTLPYVYSLNGGPSQVSGTFGSLIAGTYTITVTDNNLCTFDIPVIITEPVPPLKGIITSQTDIVCYGASTGSVTVEASDGVSPYEYAIDGGVYQLSGTFGSLAAGPHTVTIRDAALTTLDVPVNIAQPAIPFSGITTVTDVLCFGDATGSADLTVTGGTAPYTFLWSNGSTTEDLSNIPAGNYTVIITDAINCTSNGSAVVSEPASALSGTTVITNAPCSGTSTGAVDLTVTGGTAPYTFLWSTGDTNEDLLNVPAGVYTVTISDANGCTSGTSSSVTELGGNISITDVRCAGGSDGSLDLTVTGGLAPFTFLWSNGATTEDITDLTAGDYNVTLTDASSCSINISVTLAEPVVLNGTINTSNVSCFGDASGMADLLISGGTSPYTYLWDNGVITEDLIAVQAGDYSVTVTDANGCVFTGSVTISQPVSALTSGIAIQSEITCSGSADGSVLVTASGGVLPYEFSVNGGPFQPSGLFSGLDASTYTFTVRDANLCTVDDDMTLTQPLDLTIEYTKSDATCPGIPDGGIILTISGGQPPYNAIWSDGITTVDRLLIPDGLYSVAVTDFNGCAASIDITVGFSGTEGCLEIPTIITPNGDGYNDTWIMKNIDLFPEAELFIYNRWGERVFHTRNILANPWDGTLDGKLLPTDSYHYVLHLNNGSDPRSGAISIIR